MLGFCLAGCAPAAAEAAAGTNSSSSESSLATQAQYFEGGTNTFLNWVEFSAGGAFVDGDSKQFRQRETIRSGAFGGIEDLHLETKLGKKELLQIDARALFDNHDYSLSLKASDPDLGFLRAGYKQYRTWYDGGGGFFSPTATYYSLFDHALALDRGEAWLDGEFKLNDSLALTFKYSHQFRDGQKDSTSWGYVHPAGLPVVRGLTPSFRDIDEKSDTFQADLTYLIKKTKLGVGMRYEWGKLDDALKINQFPGDSFGTKITDREVTRYDAFSVHTSTETWLNPKAFFSTGFMFANLDSDFYGSRIAGTDWDAPYNPALANSLGFVNMGGSSRAHEYVGNINLMYVPWPNFSIVPSVRVQREDLDSTSQGTQTGPLAGLGTPFDAYSTRGLLDVTEQLELRYTGVTNWVFYARGDWTQGEGDLSETGGIGPTPPVLRLTDDGRLLQKYTVGANWYPLRRLSLNAQYYHKMVDNDYNNKVDNTPNNGPDRYPAYLVAQNFTVDDANLQLTWRPFRNSSFVSRYDFQYSTIDTKPDPISTFSEVESGRMISHVFGHNINWVPWSRLYLQLGFNCVISKTETPASDFTQAILEARNNYWTLNFNSGFALDNKTDLTAQYFYFRSDNYDNNSAYGVPYGVGAEEHGVTVGITRRLRENLRLNLKYGFFSYHDSTAGGNKDYTAHLIYSSLQCRF